MFRIFNLGLITLAVGLAVLSAPTVGHSAEQFSGGSFGVLLVEGERGSIAYSINHENTWEMVNLFTAIKLEKGLLYSGQGGEQYIGRVMLTGQRSLPYGLSAGLGTGMYQFFISGGNDESATAYSVQLSGKFLSGIEFSIGSDVIPGKNMYYPHMGLVINF